MLRPSFILIILVFVCLPVGLIYAQQPSSRAVTDEIEKVIKGTEKELKGEIRRLEYDVKAIQRDQMNYKIEKDALKEIYSSNLQTINVVIALVLFAISVLAVIFGYMGFRNIAKARKQYAREIQRIKRLRSKLNAKIRSISEEYERMGAATLCQESCGTWQFLVPDFRGV
jgi:hypothetical protein